MVDTICKTKKNTYLCGVIMESKGTEWSPYFVPLGV